MTTVEDIKRRLAGRYDVERELGRGGMGAVYLARDVKLGRLVALKVLPAEYATQTGVRERFLRETRMAASFSHPNIVPVYSVEEGDDLLAYVMGYIEGESLAERVRRAGPLGVRETVRLLQDVGYALAYAHGRGIVHRDIKPDNIMIERATGRALVMDFGVSRVIAAQDNTATEGLTRVGEVVGTAEYMSPEQATGDRVDGRSDLYSLGLTAYFAVTGRVAMAAENTSKALVKQITEILPPMHSVRGDLPVPLSDAIDTCLAKDPDARFERAEALVEALDAAQLAAPEIPVPIRMFGQEAATLSMVLIGGVALMYFVMRSMQAEDLSIVDMLIPLVLILAVLLTRVFQTVAQARRLAVNGFTSEAVNRALRATVDERKAQRDDLRAIPTARHRRRLIAMLSLVGIVWSYVAQIAVLRLMRTQIGPHSFQISLLGISIIFASAIVFGVSLAVFVRSPFRMPIGERLFRFVWLGPVGRGIVRIAGRGIARESGVSAGSRASVVVAAKPTSAISPPVSAPNGRLEALEGRVEELERWRRER